MVYPCATRIKGVEKLVNIPTFETLFASVFVRNLPTIIGWTHHSGMGYHRESWFALKPTITFAIATH